ncbi:hypothetical protein [Bremerella sp. P1]|uniref:hypothetical protein n=1 Tax=Bremerella sp. P1 TaxID=3026424 RepID=UPI002368427C|nr:hypothetical protein [Bremerella sp. P1]WDI44761.1 hypothetical protein PSR63_12525 [Bremerella sp. P1]
MDEQVKERLVDSLDKVMQWAEGAEEFVLEQAPLVAQEIVAWKFYEGLCWGIVLATVIVAVLTAAAIACWVIISNSEDSEGKVFAVFPPLFAAFPIVPATVCLAQCVVQSVQACVAPRLVIIDYLSQLM